jgi:D-threo-aldose 1-dehydrogenase
MTNRRDFLTHTLAGGALLAAGPFIKSSSNLAMAAEPQREKKHYQLPHHFGLGGVAIGNAFKPTTDAEALRTLEAAWNSGVRYFDTSPFYGFGISERRYGAFLDDKNRDEYILSTKVGRIFHAAKKQAGVGIWNNPAPFDFKYDYTASGARRSVEDSLQRLGIERLDIVYIHDLSPDNKDLGKDWMKFFEVARKGAMKELSKMREEGMIKGWGLGVNEIDPILKTLEVADPDICLSATQYSLIKHEDALNRLFPACDKKGVKIVVGAPLNAGFLAGVERYDYEGKFPEGVKEKRSKIMELAKNHGIDLRTAALQFSNAPETVAAVIPGARSKEQMEQNAASMKVKIPEGFWKDLKDQNLISQNAPIPTGPN